MDVGRIADEVVRRSGIARGAASVITLDRSHADRVLADLLVFVAGRDTPALFLKVTPERALAADLEREFRNLEHLARHGDDALRPSVPAPVSFGEIEGVAVLAETVVAGVRMKNLVPDAYFRSTRFRTDFARVVDWLLAFQRVFGTRWVEDPRAEADAEVQIDRYRAAFQRSPALDGLLDETVGRLRDRPVPAGPWHGDFCTANVHVTPDHRIGVIDWEEPRSSASPLADLLHFGASIWVTPYRKGPAARGANFRELFFGHGHAARAVHDQMSRFAAALGTERRDLLPLSVLAWVAHANRKRERLATLAPAGGQAAEGHWPLVLIEGDACLNLEWLAEQRERYALSRD